MTTKPRRLKWPLYLLLVLLAVSVVIAYRTRPRDLGRELRYAVFQGDHPRVEQLLREHPALINQTAVSAPRPASRRPATLGQQNVMEEFTLFIWEGLILRPSKVLQLDKQFEYMENERLSPLQIACEKRDTSMVRLLLAHGADVHYRSLNQLQAIFLGGYGPSGIMKLLLDHGASPGATNAYGYTPLHWAVRNRDPGTLLLLLSAGADPNFQNLHGSTPLHMAAANVRASNICVTLLQHGARVDVADRGGKTPVDVALLTQNTNIARLLTSSIPAKTARP